MVNTHRAVLLFAALAIALPAPIIARAAPSPAPAAGGKAIAFKAADTSGRAWKPSDAAGRKLTLFFFCGCDACHRVARQWAALQGQGVVDQADAKRAPLTVVVFAGDASAARAFAGQTRLSAKTRLIADPDMTFSGLYRSQVCPRVFVVDPSGEIRYTNDSTDDAPQQHDEDRIVLKALKALRSEP